MDFAGQLLESSRKAATKWQQLIDAGATEAEIEKAKQNYLMQLDQYHATLLGHGHCDIYESLRK